MISKDNIYGLVSLYILYIYIYIAEGNKADEGFNRINKRYIYNIGNYIIIKNIKVYLT